MSVRTLAAKSGAVLRRDLLTAVRYRTGFWLHTIPIVAEIAGSFYLARAIGPAFRPEGLNYYPYLLVGTAVFTFLVAGIGCFITAVHEAQITGAMEVLMTTPTPPPLVIGLNSLSSFAGHGVTMLFSLLIGLSLAPSEVRHANLLGCALVLVLSVAVAVAIGIAAAALQVYTQKGVAATWLLGSVGWLFTGMTFPVESLPRPLQFVGALIPLKYSLDGMRQALLRGASWSELAPTLAILAAFCVVLLPASLYLFSRSLRAARLHGTLSFY